MENYYQNNMGATTMGGYGYGMPNAYAPNYGFTAPMQQFTNQNLAAPMNVNSVTAEEAQQMAGNKQKVLDINVDPIEIARGACNHHNVQNGMDDKVYPVNDGSGDIFCTICKERWNPEEATKEEVQAHVDQVINDMQNAKYIGDLNPAFVRDYFGALIPLLKKFPDIAAYASQNINKYFNQNAFTNANDASIYNQYYAVMGGGNPYMANAYAQQNPYMNQAYAPQQPYMGQQTPYMNNPYAAQPMYGQPATTVNPMQATVPFNTQFSDQNQMMMNGQYYPQQQAPQQYTPNFGTAQPQQSAQAPVSTDANGTTTAETVVKLN